MQYIIPGDEYLHGGTQKDFYAEGEVEEVSCPLCGGNNRQRIYTERGHIGTCICSGCELIYTSPRPKDTEENYFGTAEQFYSEARFVFRGTKAHHRDKNYRFELEEIKKLKPKGKLLDIGANCGFFLRIATQMGYDAEGVEPSPTLSNIARTEFKLKIENSFFNDANYPANHFDIVSLIDVFEHVTQPQSILKEAHRVLKDDGIICIKVPNGDYNLLKLKLATLLKKRQQHDIFNSFEHVVHYTPQTMSLMLDAAGLKIIKLILPLPIDTPMWHLYTGQYFIYPSPFILDWKRILARKLFLLTGKIQKILGLKITASPDLMFIITKK